MFPLVIGGQLVAMASALRSRAFSSGRCGYPTNSSLTPIDGRNAPEQERYTQKQCTEVDHACVGDRGASGRDCVGRARARRQDLDTHTHTCVCVCVFLCVCVCVCVCVTCVVFVRVGDRGAPGGDCVGRAGAPRS